MNIPLQISSTKLRRNKSGTTFVMLTVFIAALFGFAALSLDVGNVLREQRKANTAADSGALAAALLLTNSPQNATSITGMAQLIAGANGVTASEISASSAGAVQVGVWAGGQFFADSTTNGLYNAVRVPARRNVALNFGKVVGLSEMTPSVQSVAALVGAGQAANVIPFAISLSELSNKTFGSSLTLNDEGLGSGKWGKLDLPAAGCTGGDGYQTPGDWTGDMDTNGYDGMVSVGCVPVITGFAQVKQAWRGMPLGAVLTIPIADQIDGSGNSQTANIVGFVVVRVDFTSGGTGSGWSGQVTFLNFLEPGGGGGCPPPCVQARALVQ